MSVNQEYIPMTAMIKDKVLSTDSMVMLTHDQVSCEVQPLDSLIKEDNVSLDFAMNVSDGPNKFPGHLPKEESKAMNVPNAQKILGYPHERES